ncbi:telomere-protecting terminal protein Tpg [Streptomyces sp. ACA25]|uniref:telomere-protecting terminal protein Tpg n=1 Tax=Streptomyces sp. ACA25 TaxID=3022596 RepID=UPI002FE2CA54
MGEIQDSIETALQAVQIRPVPKSPQVQMRTLVRAEKGSTRAVAARLGVTQRAVQRYLTGQITRPSPRLAAVLDREVRRVWQPRVKQRAIRRASAAAGITGDAGPVRLHRRTRVHRRPPPAPHHRTAHPRHHRTTAERNRAGADEQHLRHIVAEGLGHAYFRDRGRRAHGLDVTLNDTTTWTST